MSADSGDGGSGSDGGRISGRDGAHTAPPRRRPFRVGKTTAAWEVSAMLRRREVAHCLLEGDFLDQVRPAPSDDPHRSRITEHNPTAVWAGYEALGHHRLIYTNTVSVLEEDMVIRAMGGGGTGITRVLLGAGEETVRGG